jgi:hypothetical protein
MKKSNRFLTKLLSKSFFMTNQPLFYLPFCFLPKISGAFSRGTVSLLT